MSRIERVAAQRRWRNLPACCNFRDADQVVQNCSLLPTSPFTVTNPTNESITSGLPVLRSNPAMKIALSITVRKLFPGSKSVGDDFRSGRLLASFLFLKLFHRQLLCSFQSICCGHFHIRFHPDSLPVCLRHGIERFSKRHPDREVFGNRVP
jgi:hypothetical protein